MTDKPLAKFSAEQTAAFLGGGELGRPKYADPEMQKKQEVHRAALRDTFEVCTERLVEALHDLSPQTAERLDAWHKAAMEGDADAARMYAVMVAELAKQALLP